jgi:hypothetical protein
MMFLRQTGMPISEILAEARGAEQKALLRPIAWRAFEVPKHRSKDVRRSAVKECRSDAELRCYKSIESLAGQ